jgi:Na+/H+-dicarboxylate symporter/ABC-type amino acid transport substrate-binding protein
MSGHDDDQVERQPGAGTASPPRRRIGLSTLILIGLGLGAVAGLLFGDLMSPLGALGDAYVKFTQITVLPYIVLSLIHGVGSLNVRTAKRLATRGLPVVLMFWIVIIAVYLVVGTAFPTRTAQTFYDPNRFPGAPTPSFDWMSYIPSNPFASLADGMVPAVVIFSLCVGIALVGVSRKEGFLDGLDFVNGVLGRVNHAIFKYVSPVGTFAIMANTVGTLSSEKFLGVSVYFVCYVAAVGLLAAGVLPLITMVFTGLKYRQIFSAIKAPLLLGFTTGSVFITLPLLAEGARELLQARGASKDSAKEVTDTLVPVAYALPLTGKFAVFLFLPFSAWFAGVTLEPQQYVMLVASGVLSLFGSMTGTVVFLLQQLNLPGESVNLFSAAGSLLANIYGVVEPATQAMLTVLAGAAVLGLARFRVRRALVCGAVAVAVVLAGTAGLAVVLGPFGDTGTTTVDTLQRMRVEPSVQGVVYMSRGEAPAPAAPAGADSVLARVQRSGVLRVGYAPTAFPFSYFNKQRVLVGFDVQRAYDLAAMLKCTRVEFIPVDRQYFPPDLKSGFVDIVMGAVIVTPDLYEKVDFSDVYLTLHAAVVVPDAAARTYKSREAIGRLKGKRLAIEKGSYYAGLLRRVLPNFTVVELDDPMDFFRKPGVADALFTSAEEGSAYTLMYPRYEAVAPHMAYPQLYLAYPVAKNQYEWTGFLNNWNSMEKKSGIALEEYEYWVTGKTAVEKKPRWSVVRDVLHWMK